MAEKLKETISRRK